MNFDQWWAEEASEAIKEHSKYFGLDKEKIRKLAIKAKIEDNDMDDIEVVMYYRFDKGKENSYFNWMRNGKVIFEQEIGEFLRNDMGMFEN